MRGKKERGERKRKGRRREKERRRQERRQSRERLILERKKNSKLVKRGKETNIRERERTSVN